MQVDLERVKFLVREATKLSPGRPALRLGLRAALAVAAPMAVASQIGAIVTAWATLGGFGIVLVDKGGAYRTRAIAMSTAALGGAIAVLAGTFSAGSHAELAVTALGTGMCAMAATWTGPAVAVGNIIALQLIVATTLPHDPARPWAPAIGFLAGAAWSVVLSLFLWPVRVYRPARMAAAQCVREVGKHALAIAARDDDGAASWREAITRRHRAMRETLEAARGVLAATRRGRRGEIGRGARLLVAVEMADQMFGVLIGAEEVIDQLSGEARAAIGGAITAGLTAAAERLDDLADRIVVEEVLPELPPLAWHGEARARRDGLSALARAEAEHVLTLIARIHDDVAAMQSIVDRLDDERDRQPTTSAAHSLSQPMPADIVALANAPAPAPAVHVADSLPWNEALRSSLDLDSVVLRHALRVAVVALAAVVVTRALHLQRGYWASLTAVLLLQPYLPATITRGLQRVGGTIIGGVVATAIAAIVHDPLGIALIAIALAGVSAAVIQINYGLYALFLTPTFVLLAEVHARDGHLVQLRITNTLLGAGLAVAGALLLWPSRESTRTGDRLADAIDAAAGYLHEVFAAVTTHAPAHAPAEIAARRVAGRAFNHADLSLDRLIAEGPPPGVLEPQMAVVTMTRRLAASLSAFASAREATDPDAASTVLTAIATDAETYLHAAATALRDDHARTAPPAYHRHDGLVGVLPPLLAARVLRIDLQLSIIAEAVSRSVKARA